MARINDLNMSMKDVLVMLGEGNPGALSVMCQMLKEGPEIDPQSADPFLAVLALDTHEIYGSDIWILYKDICGQDMTKMLGVLRSIQLGHTRESEVKDQIAVPRKAGEPVLDVDSMLTKVRSELPEFGKQAEVKVDLHSPAVNSPRTGNAAGECELEGS